MILFDLNDDLIKQFLAQPMAQMRIKHLIIVYFVSLGFTYSEIQEITGVKENSIKTIMRRHTEQKELHSSNHSPISYPSDRGGLIQLIFLKNFLRGLQTRYQPDFNEQILLSHINLAYPNAAQTYPDIKTITEYKLQEKVIQAMEAEIHRIPNLEAEKRMDELSYGSLLSFFSHGTGPIPMLDTFNNRFPQKNSKNLAERVFSGTGLVGTGLNLDQIIPSRFEFEFVTDEQTLCPTCGRIIFARVQREKFERCAILAFGFATANPDSPDKRNNFTLAFTIRSPPQKKVILQHPKYNYFPDNFYSNLTIFVKQIRNLLQSQAKKEIILKEMVNAQSYITKTVMVYEQFEELDFNIRIPFTTSELLGADYDIKLPANLTEAQIRIIRDLVRNLDPKEITQSDIDRLLAM